MKNKRILLLFMVGQIATQLASAQQTPNPPLYRNFPLVVGLQFQSLGVPFKSFASSFSNPGIRVGTEVSLTGRQAQDWAQGFNVVYNLNKHAGNSISYYTQTIYRPTIIGKFYTDVKAGFGFTSFMHPADAFREVNGTWQNQGTAGKTLLMVPLSVGMGYTAYHSGSTYVSPFVSYDFSALANYDRIVPVLPVSAFQIGTRVYFISLSQRK